MTHPRTGSLRSSARQESHIASPAKSHSRHCLFQQEIAKPFVSTVPIVTVLRVKSPLLALFPSPGQNPQTIWQAQAMSFDN